MILWQEIMTFWRRTALAIACGLVVAMLTDSLSYSIGVSKSIPSVGGVVAFLVSTLTVMTVVYGRRPIG